MKNPGSEKKKMDRATMRAIESSAEAVERSYRHLVDRRLARGRG